MNVSDDPNSDAALHRELRALPNLRAPDTLVPRVLAVLEARAARPWWQRPWPAWPFAGQVASAAAFVAGLGLLMWAAPRMWEPARSSLSGIEEWWQVAATLSGTARGLVQTSPVRGWLLAGGIAVLYLSTVALAAACVRVAGNKT